MGLTAFRRASAPTPMGERLLAFMSANNVRDPEEFAEGILGISLAEFERWLYEPLSPDEVPLRPLLRCADALGTNPEYLTCITNDPRSSFMLTYDEAVLVQSFRDAAASDREELLRRAQDAAARGPSRPHHNQPFRMTRRRYPPGPANET